MFALLGALVAGALTTLAPCVLPVLPVVVGGSITPTAAGDAQRRGWQRALIVTAALGVSVFAFTLLLKASTALIGIDPVVWRVLAGGLLIALGLAGVFPTLWDRVAVAIGLQRRTAGGLSSAARRDGTLGAVLTGAALGPVFSSCSPLYGYVVVTVLPARPGYGVVLLTAYVLGLCATLLLIALAGRRLMGRIGWLADPHGWVRRGLGLLFIVVGVMVLTGLDHQLQAWLIQHSPLRPWELDSGFIPDA